MKLEKTARFFGKKRIAEVWEEMKTELKYF
jgi:hypothetical protein